LLIGSRGLDLLGLLLAEAMNPRVARSEMVVTAFGAARPPEFFERRVEHWDVLTPRSKHGAQRELHLNSVDQVDRLGGPQRIDHFGRRDQQLTVAQQATELDDVPLQIRMWRVRFDQWGSAV
jgi:hypothetical protein